MDSNTSSNLISDTDDDRCSNSSLDVVDDDEEADFPVTTVAVNSPEECDMLEKIIRVFDVVDQVK